MNGVLLVRNPCREAKGRIEAYCRKIKPRVGVRACACGRASSQNHHHCTMHCASTRLQAPTQLGLPSFSKRALPCV